MIWTSLSFSLFFNWLLEKKGQKIKNEAIVWLIYINALRLVLGSKDSFLEINVPKSIGKEIIQEWREVMLSIPFSPLFLFLWINSRKKKTHATAYTKLWCFNTYVYIIRCDPKKFEVNWFFILPYNCLDIKKKKKKKK